MKNLKSCLEKEHNKNLKLKLLEENHEIEKQIEIFCELIIESYLLNSDCDEEQ